MEGVGTIGHQIRHRTPQGNSTKWRRETGRRCAPRLFAEHLLCWRKSDFGCDVPHDRFVSSAKGQAGFNLSPCRHHLPTTADAHPNPPHYDPRTANAAKYTYSRSASHARRRNADLRDLIYGRISSLSGNLRRVGSLEQSSTSRKKQHQSRPFGKDHG